MPYEVLIDVAQEKDIARIEYLIEAGYRRDEARLGWTHEIDILAGDRLAEGEIAKSMANFKNQFFVAKINGNIEGVICVSDDNGIFEFGKFAVNPNLQGRGIGRKLIAKVQEFVKNQWHGKKLQLAVISIRHELRDYYSRCGFIDTGVRIDFIKVHPYVILKQGAPKSLEVMIMEKPL